MKQRYSLFQKCLVTALLLLMAPIPEFSTASLDKDDLTSEQVIARHLDSIGSPEARSSVTSRVILGTVLATARVGGTGQAQGQAVLASRGANSLIGMVFAVPNYPHEKMGYDGKKLTVAELTPGVRSELGKFFMAHEMPFREGLLAGTLSTAWPLLNVTSRKAVLKYDGTKKLEGRRLFVLRYETKNDSGLKTKLYFDAETFRHVRTEYEHRIIQQMANQPGVTQQQGDSITKLVEEFSDFRTEGGLTLPHSYKLQLSIEMLSRRILQDWTLTLSQFIANRTLPDKEFDVTSGK
ncbi:MAG: hypothetical protein ACR2LM_17015 [Pyrinomonadaceae bacterium]